MMTNSIIKYELLNCLNTGAAHADEITLLFSTKFLPLVGRDKYVSEKMITMWTNFAKTGNPNSPNSNIIWRKLEKDNRSYLEIGRILNIKEGRVKQERLMFWEDLCQKINIDYPCYF
uniref:Carboxylesterase type B domain-containing protein n=1 Tax=Clastoptera arizonana TaxID=38151 RepID=A0A1B6D786_9HEMI